MRFLSDADTGFQNSHQDLFPQFLLWENHSKPTPNLTGQRTLHILFLHTVACRPYPVVVVVVDSTFGVRCHRIRKLERLLAIADLFGVVPACLLAMGVALQAKAVADNIVAALKLTPFVELRKMSSAALEIQLREELKPMNSLCVASVFLPAEGSSGQEEQEDYTLLLYVE